MRTAAFSDPDGHIWEVAQELPPNEKLVAEGGFGGEADCRASDDTAHCDDQWAEPNVAQTSSWRLRRWLSSDAIGEIRGRAQVELAA
jgi:hypothetical protein